MTWLTAWQGGFVLGAALSLIGDAIIRKIVFWRRHHGHDHCIHCQGCLDDDRMAVGAVPKLVYCEICLDTCPEKMADPDKRWLPIEHNEIFKSKNKT